MKNMVLYLIISSGNIKSRVNRSVMLPFSDKFWPDFNIDIFFVQPIDLSPGDLLYYGGVEWLNISDFLGKIKKGLELHAMCFVFKTAVVFLCKERLRQKKKSIIVSRK